MPAVATYTKAAARRCRASITAGRVDVQTGDGASLRWQAGTFDAAFSVHTIYFWPNATQQLRELRRVLRAAARLVLGFRERSDEAIAQFPAPIYRFYSTDAVAAQLADVPELAAVFYGKVRRGLFERLQQLVARRVASGHYRERDPRIVARIIAETVTTFARHIYGDVEPTGFDLAAARTVVVDTLVAGIVKNS